MGLLYAPVMTKWQGATSEAMQMFYNMKQAEAANAQSLSVYADDKLIYEDQSLNYLFVTDQLEMMVSPEIIGQIFGYKVEALSQNSFAVTDETKTYIFTLDSNVITDETDSFQFENPVVLNEDGAYLSLHAVAMAFNQGYIFDKEENAAYVTKTSQWTGNLPESYDLRRENRVPKVGSQGTLGTCWAFASMTALESVLMPRENIAFSVDHLSLNNGFSTTQNEGGDYQIALSYLASWKGPVYEVHDPYGDGKTNTSLTAVKHLQEAVTIEEKDYDTIKRMIYTYGAVQSSFHSDIEVGNESSVYYNRDTSAYYYNGEALANHDIVIVGWDDGYPKENFNIQPEHNGAFLCQNSWGTEFGQEGYFYISYDDVNIGKNNIVYTRVDNPDNYDYIYQSDSLGWMGSIGYEDETAWLANVYTANSLESLEAISFYATGKDTTYDIYIVPQYENEDSLIHPTYLKSGHVDQAGYYTVDFIQDIEVIGDFAVIMRIHTPEAIHPVAIEYGSSQIDVEVDISDGRGFISYEGQIWQSAEENYQCNICLKAFTNAKN